METLDFLLARPVALLIVLVIGAAIGIAVERFSNRFEARKRKAYWRERNAKGKGPTLKTIENAERKQALGVDMAAEQLKAVSRAQFTSRSLLNKSEAKVFEALDKAVIARNPDFCKLAEAFGATAVAPTTLTQLQEAVRAAFDTPGPTLIYITPGLAG